MKFKTTTPKGTEGFNISYSDEKRCAESLAKILPKDWTIHFRWAQLMFCDVNYLVDKEKKEVLVQYNQNLSHWWPSVMSEVQEKIK